MRVNKNQQKPKRRSVKRTNNNNNNNRTKKRSNQLRRRSVSQKKRVVKKLNNRNNNNNRRTQSNNRRKAPRRRRRRRTQKGGFVAEVPQHCITGNGVNAGYAVADLLGAKAAAAAGGGAAGQAAEQQVLQQQEGDIKKCAKPLTFYGAELDDRSQADQKLSGLGINEQVEDDAPIASDFAVEMSEAAIARRNYNNERTNNAVQSYTDLMSQDRRYHALKDAYVDGSIVDDYGSNGITELRNLTRSEYGRSNRLETLWNSIPENLRAAGTALSNSLGNRDGNAPFGPPVTLPAITDPAE